MRMAALLGLIAMGLAAAGCNDESTAPPAIPSLDIELASPALSLVAGRSDSVAVSIACDQKQESISLSVGAMPEGLSARFDPGVVSSPRGASMLRLEVDPATPAGVYSLVVTASVQGVASKSAVLVLAITAAPVPHIGLEIGIDTLVIGQGQINLVSVTVPREAYEGTVELTVADVPAGITAKVHRAVLTAKSSVSLLEFSAAPAMARGTYQVTVTATGAGIAGQTTSLTLNVTEPLPESMVVDINLDGALCVWGYWDEAWPFTVTRLGGYSGPIDVSIEGVPTGVVPIFSFWPEFGGGVSGSVVFVERSVPGGSDYIIIRARGKGVADALVLFRYCSWQPVDS